MTRRLAHSRGGWQYDSMKLGDARVQIGSAAFGLAGVAFGLGLQIGVSVFTGNGWWKVGIGTFAVLCLIFVLWTIVRQNLPQ
jgi:hypothetical protein